MQVILTAQYPQQANNLSALPEGAAGIRATLKAMARAARAAETDITIRNLAESIIGVIPGRDYAGELAAIQSWVMHNIRYTRDPVNTETLKTPAALLESPQGDCDDQATLVAALVMTIGFPARFVAIGVETPGIFEHVYTEAKLGTVWLSVETTEDVPIGWRPENVVSRMEWHL
ncbi:MAG: transglutaminase-like domain-containing protein [Candidatus Limnocylindrales bacterium]